MMSTAFNRLVAGTALCLMAIAPAAAAGPFDGEIGAFYWANTHETSTSAGNGSADGDAPGFRAEVWMLDKYGVRAGQFTSNVDEVGTEGADYTSVDLMWRAFNPTPNKYVALGLGWQQMELDSIGLDEDTSGMRVSAEGRLGLPGPWAAYGLASYLPELGDAAATNELDGRFEDLRGFEYELGFAWTVVPAVSLRAGYRAHSIDFTQSIDEVSPTNDDGGLMGDGQGGSGPINLAPAAPIDEGCTSCAAAVTEFDGSAESDGYFVGLTFSF